MTIDPIQLLKQIGFSDSESAVYLAAIAYGPASAIQLAKHSELTRQMIYTILPRLEKEGLIKEVRSGSKRLFAATDPKILEDRVNDIARDIRHTIPQLQVMQSQNDSLPIMTIYDTPASMREWYRRFMKDAEMDDELLLWVTNEVWMSTDPGYLKSLIQFKNKKKIQDKIIAPDTIASRAMAKQMKQPYAEYRFWSGQWTAPAEKWIWRDTVSLLSISGNTSNLIVLQSASLAAMERASFYGVWNNLPQK